MDLLMVKVEEERTHPNSTVGSSISLARTFVIKNTFPSFFLSSVTRHTPSPSSLKAEVETFPWIPRAPVSYVTILPLLTCLATLE